MIHGKCGQQSKAAERTFCGELVAKASGKVARVTGVNRRQAGRSYVTCPNCLAELDRRRRAAAPLPAAANDVDSFPALPLFGKGMP